MCSKNQKEKQQTKIFFLCHENTPILLFVQLICLTDFDLLQFFKRLNLIIVKIFYLLEFVLIRVITLMNIPLPVTVQNKIRGGYFCARCDGGVYCRGGAWGKGKIAGGLVRRSKGGSGFPVRADTGRLSLRSASRWRSNHLPLADGARLPCRHCVPRRADVPFVRSRNRGFWSAIRRPQVRLSPATGGAIAVLGCTYCRHCRGSCRPWVRPLNAKPESEREIPDIFD